MMILHGGSEDILLVPKLCLGTYFGKLCFPSYPRLAAKQSFATVRSQAELGNEK
jgi:hypothetical protein